MPALQIEGLRLNAIREVRPEPLGPEDVRLRVRFVGLCGSDLNTFRGLNPLVELPRIPGHEIAAEVIEKGEAVGEGVKTGDLVTVWPYTSCGTCSSCRAGKVNACRTNKTLGVQRDGALRGDIVVPASSLIANDGLEPRHLALVEPLSVGFHAARRASVGSGDTVVVLGCGMIGVGAIIGAAQTGARVIAVDTMEQKRETALFAGASDFLALAGDDLIAAVADLTSGDGADVVIEAVGVPDTFRAAVDLAAFGGRIAYVGYSKAPVTYETKFFNLKELDIFGSRNSRPEDFRAAMAALKEMGPAADRLITRIIPFAEAATALPYWDTNPDKVLKLMVEL